MRTAFKADDRDRQRAVVMPLMDLFDPRASADWPISLHGAEEYIYMSRRVAMCSAR